MLTTRIITAIIAILILVPTVIWGGVGGVVLLVAAFSCVAAWELSRCLEGIKTILGSLLTLFLGLVMVICFYRLPYVTLPAALVFMPLVVLLIHLFLYSVIQKTIASTTQMIFVLGYAVIPISHAILLARLDYGSAWVIFVLVVISLGDASAYFAGKYLGKHRIPSEVSPSKTLEGYAGGVAGSFAGMLIMEVAAPGLPGVAVLAKLTLILAIIGPLGDLCASALKRRIGIKDFGGVMPGHGGVMDRADALIFAFPVAFHFLFITGNAVMP
ncbi:MAG: phosphatidate cytidylyltransferase [Desulfomonile tiedjei]|uniref:Phosphatidate cytidylyltransferase n=1 Tax=Desulfomonile tiedjei TaxID=2358 RepID=A0A9D6UWT6_9BACT|nr:phosphatidate cytidylyltransferase [Desulfomonile tiedjei]